jgi:hypothetical protein
VHALLLLLRMQDVATASTLPVLLQSLASSADDFAKSEAAAAQLAVAAASDAAQLAAAYQPMADALLQSLAHQHGRVGNAQQQQQQQVSQLPVECLEVAICRAAASAVVMPNEHEEDLQQLSHSRSANSLDGAACTTHSGGSSMLIQRSVSVLQQQLDVLGWPADSKSAAGAGADQDHRSNRSSSSSTAGEQQPHGYQIASLLPLLPASVAVAVAGTNVAAALVAVYEAAAAAGVPASSIELCSASSSSAMFAPNTKNEAADKCKWLVLLLEEASDEAVAAAARWLAAAMHAVTVIALSAQQGTSTSSSTSSSKVSSNIHHSSSSSGGSAPRIWVALPMESAAALSAATSNTCLMWRLQNCSSCTSPSSPLVANAARHAAGFVMGAMLQLQALGLLQCDSPAVHNLLQPLLVAALAAQQQLSIQQGGLVSGSGSGLNDAVLSDLSGPPDLMHLQLVLQQVAAATAAAAGLQTTGPVQQELGFHSSSSSSSSGIRRTRTAKPCKPLKHLTRLPLDLQQLQQLLQWAVFGPSCSSSTAWELSQQALQENFTAAELGVRERRGAGGACGFSEVQVQGGCIADAVEDVERQQKVLRKLQQQQMHLPGLHSRAGDGSGIIAADHEHGAGVCANVRHVEKGSGDAGSAEHGTGLPATSSAPGRLGAASSWSSRDAGGEDIAAATAAADDDDNDGDYGDEMDGDTASGCLLPLGLSLSSEALWALLLQRTTD